MFGVVLRDIVCDEIPQAFHDHRPYAVCSFASGWVVVAADLLGLAGWASLLNLVANWLGSDQPAFSERNDLISGHDKMVDDLYVDQAQGRLQRLCQQFVGPRGFCFSRGMVVGVLCPVFLCAVPGDQGRTSLAYGVHQGT